jgi:predicted amidohydrolase YtcJ
MGSTRLQNIRLWVGNGAWADHLDIVDGHVGASHGATVIDCGGRVATPGLIDAHVHLIMGAQSRAGLDLSSVVSQEDFCRCLAKAHQQLPQDQWLIANGWNETLWSPESTVPTKALLGPMGSRPTVCWRCDFHAALVNDAVLDRLDLPPDAPGRRTGLLVEDEAWAHLVPALPKPPVHEVQAAVRAAASWLNRFGITGVRSMEYREELETVLDVVAESLSLRTTVTVLDRTMPLDLSYVAQRSSDLPRIIGCKAFFDGTIGSRTARLTVPFVDRGGCGQWVELAKDNLDEAWCDMVVEAGLSPSIHAIGDAAVGRAAALLQRVPDDLRATLEHAQLVPEGQLELLANIRLSVQPTHRAEDAMAALVSLGEGRVHRMLPLKSLHEAGARLAFGTDWPVTSPDPMRTLKAAVTGQTITGDHLHGHETVDHETAMAAMTTHAAEATWLPTAAGLVPGAPADVVVWTHDPFGWTGDCPAPRPWAVFVGGEQVVDAASPTAVH